MDWKSGALNFPFRNSFTGGTILKNIKSISPFQANLPTGNTDLYTVPLNRRAAIFNPFVIVPTGAAGFITFVMQAKIGGSYFPIGTVGGARVNPGQANFTTTIGRVFNAGESVSINIATTPSVASCWVNILEFDATSHLFSPTLTSFNNGDNTLYVAPTVNGSYLLSVSASVGPFLQTTNSSQLNLGYANNSGASRTVTLFDVAAGSSPSSANQVNPTASVVGNTTRTDQTMVSYLNQGDLVDVNVDSGAATQIAWINVVEI